MLKSLASAAAMPAAKAHRYLVSFIRTNFVERDQIGGGYRLGPAALQVGLSALAGLNVVRLTAPQLPVLRDALGLTAALAVWGSYGPTNVLVEEPPTTLVINSRPGSVLPLTSTATGRIFAAFLPSSKTAQPIARELQSASLEARENFKQAVAEARALGIARSRGEFSPHIDGLSAPIFNHQAQLVAALTVSGGHGEFDTDPSGYVAKALQCAAERLSRRLGFFSTQILPKHDESQK
jgi:DNA-binding IclR family transcriptional regulator